jgi:hypothetical protein
VELSNTLAYINPAGVAVKAEGYLFEKKNIFLEKKNIKNLQNAETKIVGGMLC